MKLSHGVLTLAFVPLVFFSSAGACAIFPSLNYYLAWGLALALFALLSGWHFFAKPVDGGLTELSIRGFLLTVGAVALLGVPLGLFRWQIEAGANGLVYRLDRITGRIYSRQAFDEWVRIDDQVARPNQWGDERVAP